MAENNENRENIKSAVQNNETPEKVNGEDISGVGTVKERLIVIGKRAWEWLRGYLEIIRDWFTGKRGTRADRWAMAICLLMSISVWLYAMSTNDTGFEKEVIGVAVDIEGESALGAGNMSIINGYDNTVKVTLKGKRAEIGSLDADDLHLYVDVSQITEAGRYTLPVMLDLPSNSTLVSLEPSQVSVNVDVNGSRTVDVRIKLDYRIDASYTLSDPVPNYESVVISGPASVLDTVAYAGVNFNVGEVDKSLTLVGSLSLYDEYGMEISNPYVKCEVSEVSVAIKVTTTKTVPLSVQFANGNSMPYSVTLTPSEIKLIGDPHLLQDINEVVVYTVYDGDFAVGKKKGVSISDFDLPAGVGVADNGSVYVEIERLY